MADPPASKTAPVATSNAFDPKLAHVVTALKHTSPLIACRFDPAGKYVFAGAYDHTVQRWELATGKATSLSAHDSWVRAIAFSPDGQTTYTGGYDGRLLWWPTAAEKPQPIRKVDAHAGWLRTLAVSPDGKLIVSGGNDHAVKLWNAADGALVRTLVGHDRHVYCVYFHPSGQQLVSGDLRGVVKVWETATGKELRALDAKPLYTPNPGQGAEYGGVRSMAFSPDARHFVCGGLHQANNPFGAEQQPLVLRFEWDSGKLLQSHVANGNLRGIIWRTVFHPSGTLIGVSGGAGGGVILFWKADVAVEFHRFALPNTALDLDLHPDGLQLATAHHDRQLRLTRLAAKKA